MNSAEPDQIQRGNWGCLITAILAVVLAVIFAAGSVTIIEWLWHAFHP